MTDQPTADNTAIARDPSSTDPSAAAPPSDTDLTAALASASERPRGLSKLTLGLAGALLAVAGFVGGMFVGGNDSSSDTAAIGQGPDQMLREFPDGGGLNGGGPNGGMRIDGDATIGTVESIDGDTITVKTPDGDTVEVSAGDSTDVTITTDGSVSDLHEGDSVVVSGDTADDGSIDADSIREGIGLPTGDAS
jgi:hypothetical protein